MDELHNFPARAVSLQSLALLLCLLKLFAVEPSTLHHSHLHHLHLRYLTYSLRHLRHLTEPLETLTMGKDIQHLQGASKGAEVPLRVQRCL